MKFQRTWKHIWTVPFGLRHQPRINESMDKTSKLIFELNSEEALTSNSTTVENNTVNTQLFPDNEFLKDLIWRSIRMIFNNIGINLLLKLKQ